MSQVSQITIDNVAFGTFRSNLNDTLNALNSQHIGSTAPTTAVAGTILIDNSATNTLSGKIYDGADSLELFSINTSTNAIINGHIKSIAYYPRRLSNAQLVQLTA